MITAPVELRMKKAEWKPTEDEPCLAALKVNAEICVEAAFRDDDVGLRPSAQSAVLPVTKPDAWGNDDMHQSHGEYKKRPPPLSGPKQEVFTLTVTNSRDDTKNDGPHHQKRSEAKKKDEEQTDHGGESQTSAAETTTLKGSSRFWGFLHHTWWEQKHLLAVMLEFLIPKMISVSA